MLAYDFTALPNQPTGTPIPHFLQGCWWSWSEVMAASPVTRSDYITALTKDVAPGQLHRVPVIDPEGLKQPEKFAHTLLDDLAARGVSKSLLISKFVGMAEKLSMQDQLKAIQSGPSTAAKRAMQAQARRDRDLVRKCGIATSICVVHTPEQIDWFIDWIHATGAYLRECYQGAQTCAWLCGSYTVAPGRPQITLEHCNKIADAVWEAFDSLALYGSVEESGNLGGVIAKRLSE